MNQNKIYVGNLSYQTSSDNLSEAFSSFGDIDEVKLIVDRETGRSKGFAFITYNESDAAQEALALNGSMLDGRQIKVSIAKAEQRTGGGGGRSGGGGGGGRGRNDYRGGGGRGDGDFGGGRR